MPIPILETYSSEGVVLAEVLAEVFKLNNRLLAEEDRLAQPFGLTSARWKVLSVVSFSKQPLTVPQISRRIGLSRQNVQRLVDVMEHDGFVGFQENPDHKRARLVNLTEKGQQRYLAIIQEHIPWTNHHVEGMKRVDLDRTLYVVRKLLRQLDRAE
ncbi:MAG: MarR family winged helix-turn-helix transcriptional regulator [Nitrospirales bacterium]